MAGLCCDGSQGRVRRLDSWGVPANDEDDEDDGFAEDSADCGEAGNLAAAIDRWLKRPWRLRAKVGACFRKHARRGEDGRVGRVLTKEQTDLMLADLACRLQLPEERLFHNWQQLHERFDFSGDNSLDKYECHKLVKYVLRQRRIELVGRGASISVPHATLQGQGFSVVKELGRGGQGVMYLCSKSMDSKRYCIKFYDKANANACGLSELIDEYALMKTLSNEYIAKTYEVFQDTSFYYLVNEPYFGGDLTHLGKRAHDQGMPMSEDWWRPIFRQCLEGLAYLHRKAVMHCDIKEPNVMIADGSSYLAPKPVLIDFGLSTQFSNKGDGVSGTPGYIPPETWRTGVWYPLGDIFSMGLVFFQMMIGQVPSSSGSVMGVLQPATDVTVLRSVGLDPQLPWSRLPQDMPELTHLLRLMLQKERRLRPRAPQALEHEWFRSDSDADLPESTLQGLVGNGKSVVANEDAIERLCEEQNLDELRQMRASLDGPNGDDMQACVSARKTVHKRLRVWLKQNPGLMRRLKIAETCDDSRGNERMRRLLDEAIWTKQQYSNQYIRDLFTELDVNCDGRISADELEGLLDSEHFECPFDDIEDLIETMGVEEGGTISYEQFEDRILEDGRIAHRPAVEAEKRKCVVM